MNPKGMLTDCYLHILWCRQEKPNFLLVRKHPHGLAGPPWLSLKLVGKIRENQKEEKDYLELIVCIIKQFDVSVGVFLRIKLAIM